MNRILYAASVAFLSVGCASQVERTVISDSPNANAATNFQRCMESYTSLFKGSPDGEARLRKICADGAEQTASTAREGVAQRRTEAERELQEERRAIESALARVRAEERREQEAFDRSALGHALNSTNRALEAAIERRAQGNTPQTQPRSATESCGPSEPMFVYREALEEWEARCGRISKQRDPKLPSDPNYRPSQRPSTQIQSPTLPPPVSIAANRTTLPPVRSQADNRDGPGPVVRETYVVSCVHPERVETGGTWRPMALVNRCPAIKVNVAYCIEGSRGPFRCKGKGFEGSGSADIGQWTPIPDYFTDGGGKIIFGACAAPHYPVDLQGNEFRCSR